MRINAHGTLRLAEAAAQAGVRRFVYLSSIKVNGERAVYLRVNKQPGGNTVDVVDAVKERLPRLTGLPAGTPVPPPPPGGRPVLPAVGPGGEPILRTA